MLLNIAGYKHVTNIGISKFGEGCPHLQSLYLLGCYKVTDVGISNITNACEIVKPQMLGY